MNGAIDIAFIIGVASVFLNAWDLILPDEWKEQASSLLDTATIWLDDRRPLLWFRALESPPIRQVFALLATAVAFYLLSFPTGAPVRVVNLFFLLSYFGMALLFLPALLFPRSPDTLRLLQGQSSLRDMGRLVISGSVAGLVCVFREWRVYVLFVLAQILAEFVVLTAGAYDSSPFGFGLRHLSGICFAAYLLTKYPQEYTLSLMYGPMVVAMTIAAALAHLSHMILIFVRALAWRIVAYQKGPAAAIVVLLTSALGLIKLTLD